MDNELNCEVIDLSQYRRNMVPGVPVIRDEHPVYGPPVGSTAYHCNCGSAAFYVSPEGVHCWDCHTTHRF